MRALLSFARCTKAVAAIEFAIWAPVLCLLLLAGLDTTRYTQATRRVTELASTIGQMLSVNTLGTVNYVDLQFYNDSAMVLFPEVLADAKQQGVSWGSDIKITMSSLTFSATPTGCTTSCTYVPKMLWSAGSNRRSCTVVLTAAADTAIPSTSALPADVFGTTSLLVVDVIFTFHPTIASNLLKNITIARSYYVAPRYSSSIAYSTITGDNGIATVCP